MNWIYMQIKYYKQNERKKKMANKFDETSIVHADENA